MTPTQLVAHLRTRAGSSAQRRSAVASSPSWVRCAFLAGDMACGFQQPSLPRCLLVQACCLNLSVFLSGLSTYNSAGSSTRINSPLLMLELVRAVAFAATAGVAELDAHCLMDNPHKGGHDCYFDRFGKAQLPPPPLSCVFYDD